MAFAHKNSKGVTYYLHSKMVELKGGRMQQIFYFRKEVDAPFALEALPAGKEVIENKNTGLPLVRTIK